MTPLVLLPAFPLDSRMYDPLRALLADVELLTPELPGFGGSPLLGSAPSLDGYADSVVRWLGERGVDRAVLGGTSMGGYVTMALLRRAPELLAGVALLDTKASADSGEAVAGRRAMADRLESESRSDALVEAVYPKLLGATTVAGRPEVAARVRRWVEEASPAAAAWAQRAMAVRPDSLGTLRAVDVPTLVLVGEEDVLSPVGDAESMAAALPAARLVVVPRAGHLAPVEAPEAVAEALLELVHSVG